ncbi:MAG: TOBE domain-containing protein [Solirubrobacterales bacterium]|jgi:molybdopterin-binding protein|nr:TOBE domain-containing protein [Solirubrobacterales bacterium]
MTSTEYRVSEAADLLGVSDDTVRRWAADGRLALREGDGGSKVVDGSELAQVAAEFLVQAEGGATFSVRNRMKGIVTEVKSDGVMAQVDIQAGPFRLVSLISSEAVEELGIEVGRAVIATAKATNVGVEVAS